LVKAGRRSANSQLSINTKVSGKHAAEIGPSAFDSHVFSKSPLSQNVNSEASSAILDKTSNSMNTDCKFNINPDHEFVNKSSFDNESARIDAELQNMLNETSSTHTSLIQSDLDDFLMNPAISAFSNCIVNDGGLDQSTSFSTTQIMYPTPIDTNDTSSVLSDRRSSWNCLFSSSNISSGQPDDHMEINLSPILPNMMSESSTGVSIFKPLPILPSRTDSSITSFISSEPARDVNANHFSLMNFNSQSAFEGYSSTSPFKATSALTSSSSPEIHEQKNLTFSSSWTTFSASSCSDLVDNGSLGKVDDDTSKVEDLSWINLIDDTLVTESIEDNEVEKPSTLTSIMNDQNDSTEADNVVQSATQEMNDFNLPSAYLAGSEVRHPIPTESLLNNVLNYMTVDSMNSGDVPLPDSGVSIISSCSPVFSLSDSSSTIPSNHPQDSSDETLKNSEIQQSVKSAGEVGILSSFQKLSHKMIVCPQCSLKSYTSKAGLR
jgi:hypothetical protein